MTTHNGGYGLDYRVASLAAGMSFLLVLALVWTGTDVLQGDTAAHTETWHGVIRLFHRFGGFALMVAVPLAGVALGRIGKRLRSVDHRSMRRWGWLIRWTGLVSALFGLGAAWYCIGTGYALSEQHKAASDLLSDHGSDVVLLAHLKTGTMLLALVCGLLVLGLLMASLALRGIRHLPEQERPVSQ